MANNKKEIVKVLSVETKGSDVRVKTLRQEIAALNEVLRHFINLDDILIINKKRDA